MHRFYFCISVTAIVLAKCESYESSSASDIADTTMRTIEEPDTQKTDHVQQEKQKIEIKLFYESLCPGCMAFYPDFVKFAGKLAQYVNIHTYPYGNARMVRNENGSVTIDCQHDEPECYGNQLHACAADILDDVTYLQYNACLMEKRSNDTDADQCGKEMNISSNKVDEIKSCAKGPKGHQLQVECGKESAIADFNYVPYVLIDGVEFSDETVELLHFVCSKFNVPPPPCPQNS